VTSILHTLNPNKQIELHSIVHVLCILACCRNYAFRVQHCLWVLHDRRADKKIATGMAFLCARLWRVDFVMRRVCDELTGNELTVWRHDRVTRWPCDELTGSQQDCCRHSVAESRLVVIDSQGRVKFRGVIAIYRLAPMNLNLTLTLTLTLLTILFLLNPTI